MTTAATSLLGLALPVTGELSGTWGDTVNNSITSLLDAAVAGTTTISADTDVTLTTTTLASNQARQAVLLFSGARTALRTVTAPAQSKIYTVINATTGGFAVKLVGAGPTTGLTIPAGASAVVAWNGSDFVEIGSTTLNSLTVSGNLSVAGTTTLTGAATLTANPTLSAGTANGVAYLNGSKVLTSGSALTFDGTNLGVSTGSAAGLTGVVSINGYSTNTDQFKYLMNWSGAGVWGIGVTSSSAGGMIFGQASSIAGGVSSELMRLTSTGLGIGTSSPSAKLTLAGTAATTSQVLNSTGSTTGATYGRWFNTGSDLIWGIESSTGGSLATGSSAYAALLYTNSAVSLQFGTAGVIKATLDSSGNLGLGVTPSAWSGLTSFSIASTGSNISSASNDNLYITSGAYYNGTNWIYKATSQVVSQYNQFSGVHKWFTAASGTAGNPISFTQAMTLDASGRLAIGATSVTNGTAFGGGGQVNVAKIESAGYPCFQINTNTGGGSSVQFTNSGTVNGVIGYNASGGTNEFTINNSLSGALTFATNNSERARIDSSGNLLVGQTTTGYQNSKSAYIGSGAFIMSHSSANVSGDTFVGFGYNTAQIGSINQSGTTAVTYNTTSDYRLKNVIGAVSGSGERIDALEPVEYTWKADGSRTRGFLAHKFQEVYAGSVTGTKDAVDKEGKPVYQAMQASSSEVIADLVAEIKSLRKRLAALEAK